MKKTGRLLFGAIVLLALEASSWGQTPPAAQPLAGPWVELGTDNDLQVRVVVQSNVAACPVVVADGKTIEARQRGAADGNFPITVCGAAVPLATKTLTVGGDAVPTLPAAINRIVVFGDTGCRIEGSTAQDCDDKKQWPFPVIAKDAAGRKPDLVIHVGDYYYREDACPAGNKGCKDSPHGDNWAAWKADFFEPAAPLLAAAPWVMVRGNHELCQRGGAGWIRLLDPRGDMPECADTSPPYPLHLGGLDLMVFDSANADDTKPDPKKVAVYAAQFAQLLANAPKGSWLVTHRPVWALGKGKNPGETVNQTLQAAIKGHVQASLDMVVSGHLHDFASYSFGPQRPAQLIAGVGGDTMDALPNEKLVGATIDGMKTTKGFALERFGFFVMERHDAGWNGTLYDPDGKTVLAQCTIAGRDLDCHN
jgi:Calcineurin-like phosphoesterase